jgi:hypothetical protein
LLKAPPGALRKIVGSVLTPFLPLCLDGKSSSVRTFVSPRLEIDGLTTRSVGRHTTIDAAR